MTKQTKDFRVHGRIESAAWLALATAVLSGCGGSDGAVTASDGLIPGREYIAALDDGSGRANQIGFSGTALAVPN